jgi:hypothetical protein
MCLLMRVAVLLPQFLVACLWLLMWMLAGSLQLASVTV